ncbi:MAG: AmmeMemoRadiSam system protein A [Deltaproteobacteria bacterium]|nr:AmmeMemoRadiSam system protein A [Deltaproteobacteria bacterium]
MEEKTEIRGACFSSEEKQELLRIARDALVAYVTEGQMPAETPAHPALSAPGAAFVTLRSGDRLRGCIGYTEPHAPLYRTVQECIVAAATEDPRFPRVMAEEAGGVRIEISVLTPLLTVRPEDVQPGVHGLMIQKGAKRGLLLPQVAVEHGWDRETLLAQVCVKAGLPADAWREDAELYSFTAEVFGE